MKWIFLIFIANLFSQEIDKVLSSDLTDSAKVEALITRSFIEDEFITSKASVDSAFSLSHNSIFHRGKALSFQAYGDLYFRVDSIVRAINYYQLAEYGFKDLKLDKEIAIVQFKMAKTYQEVKLLNESNETFIKLLKTYEKIGTNPEMIYSELASNYDDLGKKDSFELYRNKLKGEYSEATTSKSYSNSEISAYQADYNVFILRNELQKANFRTDIITYLLTAIIIVLVLLVAYLFFTRKKSSIKDQED